MFRQETRSPIKTKTIVYVHYLIHGPKFWASVFLIIIMPLSVSHTSASMAPRWTAADDAAVSAAASARSGRAWPDWVDCPNRGRITADEASKRHCCVRGKRPRPRPCGDCKWRRGAIGRPSGQTYRAAHAALNADARSRGKGRRGSQTDTGRFA